MGLYLIYFFNHAPFPNFKLSTRRNLHLKSLKNHHHFSHRIYIFLLFVLSIMIWWFDVWEIVLQPWPNKHTIFYLYFLSFGSTSFFEPVMDVIEMSMNQRSLAPHYKLHKKLFQCKWLLLLIWLLILTSCDLDVFWMSNEH